jgi:hypothetical protein
LQGSVTNGMWAMGEENAPVSGLRKQAEHGGINHCKESKRPFGGDRYSYTS